MKTLRSQRSLRSQTTEDSEVEVEESAGFIWRLSVWGLSTLVRACANNNFRSPPADGGSPAPLWWSEGGGR